MSRIRRVHHPDVGPGREIVLSPEESHHVIRVLRLRPGDAVRVFDGRGGEWEGVLVSLGPGEARVRTGAPIETPVDPDLEVVLFQSYCRTDRLEWVLQKGTEVGISTFRLVATERVEARRAEDRLARWRRIALEASKQCGRRRVPVIESCPGPPGGLAAGVRALVLTGGPAGRPVGELLTGRPPGAVWLAVGPEGGFSGDEVGQRVALGWEAASLGPRTLRTETAGVVAATLVLHVWGDLGPRQGGSV